MSLELAAVLLSSPLVRTIAVDVATSLVSQAVQHAVAGRREGQPTKVEPVGAELPSPRLRVVPSIEVISSVPGRLRLRVPSVRDDAIRAADLTRLARTLAGIERAEVNLQTASLVVKFDPRQVGSDQIIALVDAVERESRGHAADAQLGQRSGRHLRVV